MMLRISMPRTITPLSRMRLSGMRGISPAAKPITTKRLPHFVARSACSEYGPPTGSTTTPAPPPVSSLARTFRSSFV